MSVACLVCNGEPWIRSFLDHYFKLGAVHVCFIDNGSTDRTIEIAQSYEKVSILSSDLPYGRYKYFLKWYLAEQFHGDGWLLITDVDEHFNYPLSTQLELSGLLRYLNHYQYTGVVTQMLDMFSNQPLRRSASTAAGPMKEIYNCYELEEVVPVKLNIFKNLSNTISNDEIKAFKCGVRKRLFDAYPLLTKSALLRPRNTNARPSTVSSHRITGAKLADISCVLLHYKFIDGFYDYVDWAIDSKVYYKNSSEYKLYQKLLQDTPEMNIASSSSKTLKSIDQLVDEEFLVLSDAYRDWIAKDVTDL